MFLNILSSSNSSLLFFHEGNDLKYCFVHKYEHNYLWNEVKDATDSETKSKSHKQNHITYNVKGSLSSNDLKWFLMMLFYDGTIKFNSLFEYQMCQVSLYTVSNQYYLQLLS